MAKENISNIFMMLLIGLLGGLVSSYLYISLNSQLFSTISINNIEEKTVIQENTALKNGINIVKDSLVYINRGNEVFTGIAITTDGLIATMSSNIRSGDIITTSSQEKVLSYNILKRDEESGIALIKIEGNRLKPVEFINPNNELIGERIYSLSIISNPTFSFSINEGIIKHKKDNLFSTSIIEFDINRSGSPVFDIEHRLIGIAKHNKDGSISIISLEKIKELAGFN